LQTFSIERCPAWRRRRRAGPQGRCTRGGARGCSRDRCGRALDV